MDEQNRINIVIIGEVSAGKSTLLNSMFIKTLSEMKRIRTTMSANIYFETDDKNLLMNADAILKKNTEFETSAKGQPLTELKENIFYVPKSVSFGDKNKKKDYGLNIIDIPGLNDGNGNQVIKDWISKNFHKIDVVLFVINGEYAMNTESERGLFKFIIENVKKYPYVTLMNLINKYDNPYDDELNELKDQACKFISDTLKEEKMHEYTDFKNVIIPICAEKAYLYRYIEFNKTLEGFSKKHRAELISLQLGPAAVKQDDSKIMAKLLKSIEESKNEPESYYNQTKYSEFITYFRENVVDICDKIYTKRLLGKINRTVSNASTKELETLSFFDVIFKEYRKIRQMIAGLFTDKQIQQPLTKLIENAATIERLSEVVLMLSTNNDVVDTITDKKDITTLKKLLLEKSEKLLSFSTTGYPMCHNLAKYCDILDKFVGMSVNAKNLLNDDDATKLLKLSYCDTINKISNFDTIFDEQTLKHTDVSKHFLLHTSQKHIIFKNASLHDTFLTLLTLVSSYGMIRKKDIFKYYIQKELINKYPKLKIATPNYYLTSSISSWTINDFNYVKHHIKTEIMSVDEDVFNFPDVDSIAKDAMWLKEHSDKLIESDSDDNNSDEVSQKSPSPIKQNSKSKPKKASNRKSKD